ncbi:MAG TPA: hypothetical protein VKY74_10260, partial [Chloroflexia bacterium]|nr:hypothetical protein [Chloroflexia bacterium]
MDAAPGLDPDAADPEGGSFRQRYLTARRRAEALYNLSTLITSTLELEPIVELLLSQTRQLFGADRAAVFLRGPGDTLRCANAVGLSAG